MNETSIASQLGTVTGIVVLALGIVQVLKLLLGKYKVGIVSDLPTPLLCVGVSMGLTLLASLALKTLPGQWYDLLWQAVLASGAASGFFTWLKEPMDSPTNKSNKIPLILVLGVGVALTGCTGMSKGQQYILATQTYASTANTVAALVRAGEFGTADKAKIRAVNDTCVVLIMEMRDDLLQDNTPFDFQYTLRQFQTVLDELLRMQLKAEAAKPKEISTNGPDNPNLHRPDSGAEHGLAAGQGDLRVPADRTGADRIGDRRGNAGGDGRPREPGRRPEWRVAHPSPAIAYGAPEIEYD